MENVKHTFREAEIEKRFIEQLVGLGYKYRRDIKDKHSLETNFKKHFNRLNYVNLTESEFERLKNKIISDDVFSSSQILRRVNDMYRDDDTPLSYTLVDIKDWCRNEFEVVNQLRINTDNSFHRYDVVILINGIPVVQIELKEYAINPKAAMEQIIKYKNDMGSSYTNSLFCFMQLFIVSNGHNTFYFANNNNEYFRFNSDERYLPVYEYADINNKKIVELEEFTNVFLQKCDLAATISRYMVLVETEKRILIMRPYQIAAVQAILNCVRENRGNGYIWHTTGSGKTLTSFKASTLLKTDKSIDKCLFVVDRKDLDSQTRAEFNKFQKDCVEENTNTHNLVKRLLSKDIRDKIIVTTMQKLGIALDDGSIQNKMLINKGKETYRSLLEPLKDKRFVIIFDECHRSQFGDYHTKIKNFFPNSQLFGFTGTPIFEENATQKYVEDNVKKIRTTKSVFEKELHRYTIGNAIDDGNVLKFHIDYYKNGDEKTFGKNTPTIYKEKIVDTILDIHNMLTDNKRFNALFAVSRIDEAIKYYSIFKKKILELNRDDINIGCIFSPPAEGNKDIKQMQEDLVQEQEDNKENPNEKKAALIEIINDYNKKYSTNYDINSFNEYYTDIQNRIKGHEYSNKDNSHDNKVDIVIVVEMLLTGFDSKYLNTLYVDKNLKYHDLIQAFSRTNRILNSMKPHGNIIDFRNQRESVDEAVALFSGPDNKESGEGSSVVWVLDDYKTVKIEYENAVNELKEFFEKMNLEFSPSQVKNIHGDSSRIEFIDKFKKVQKFKVELSQYTTIPEDDKKAIENLISEDDLRGYRVEYLDLAHKLKDSKKTNVDNGAISDEIKAVPDDENEPLVIDVDYVLFSSVVVDYDYIMSLISKYTYSGSSSSTEMTKDEIIDALKSYSNLIEERDDIIDYVKTLKVGECISVNDIKEGYKKYKEYKRSKELKDIAEKFNINKDKLVRFALDIVRQKHFNGEDLSNILPDNVGWKEKSDIELRLMRMLIPVLNKMAEGREIRGLELYDNN